jgi:gliding motility-associated-like protein
MKILIIFIYLVLFVIGNSFSQENCSNGIDDDGDNLVDLQDPLCQCRFSVTANLLRNASFESFDHCPTYFYNNDSHVIDHWQYGTYTNVNEAVYYHNFNCSYDSAQVMLFQAPNLPLPDGNAFIAIKQQLPPGSIVAEKDIAKVYISQCLEQPLTGGEQYTFSFNAGRFQSNDDRDFIYKNEPFTVAIFGHPDCSAIPFGTTNSAANGCPANYPGWVLLGKTVVHSKGDWVQGKISFIAPPGIQAVTIGPDCSIPKSDIHLTDSTTLLDYYVYYLDDLHLLPTKDYHFPHIAGNINGLCETSDVLTAPGITGAESHQWYKNDIAIAGAIGKQYSVPVNEAEGIYNVRIVVPGSCLLSEPFVVSASSIAALNIPADTILCTGDTLLMAAPLDGISYTINGSIAASIKIFKAGNYKIIAGDINGCTKEFNVSVVDRNCTIFIPRSFTPNGDGLNDIFRIPQAGMIQLKEFAVYNRWGLKIFTTSENSRGWDGNYKDRQSPAGVYTYSITGSVNGKVRNLSGTIILLR